MQWIEIQKPCPVLNTPDFHRVFSGNQFSLNGKEQPYHFEFVALPGMRFELLQDLSPYIVQILWPEYSVKPLYIDRRFTTSWLDSSPQSKKTIPSAQSLLAHMQKRIGTPYVWGGNWAEGTPEMLLLYPPSGPLDTRSEELWTLRGLDCSGLLFEASEGSTPRNTSHLLHFGHPLDHENFSDLLPMDMIIYPGHVLFVLDSQTTIESRFPTGVYVSSLSKRLDEIYQQRKFIRKWTASTNPISHFTIRRFAF